MLDMSREQFVKIFYTGLICFTLIKLGAVEVCALDVLHIHLFLAWQQIRYDMQFSFSNLSLPQP